MRLFLPVLALPLVALSSCFLAPEKDAPPPFVDRDGDGDPAATDCDDDDPTRHAGAVEICDAIDNDCDRLIDERMQEVWYLDNDGDGWGDPATRTVGCSVPADTVSVGGDCNDDDPTIRPDTTDQCDGVDRNCDGQVISPDGPWYQDSDGDGFGNPAAAYSGCNPPQGYVDDASDCNDGNPLVHPDAFELCNGIDDNCDPADDLLLGSDVSCPAEDCEDLLDQLPGIPDGTYWIDPGGVAPFQAYCDQTREGGGWTLVYAYTFVDYAGFAAGWNAVTPVPNWPVLVSVDEPQSSTPPLSETDYDAMDHARWGLIGDELFVVSNINDWVVCQEGPGTLTGPNNGYITCTNVMDIAPACSGLAPILVYQYNHGWGLWGPTSLFYYWEGSTTTGNWPTHDPCGTNAANQLTGVVDPRGAIYVR